MVRTPDRGARAGDPLRRAHRRFGGFADRRARCWRRSAAWIAWRGRGARRPGSTVPTLLVAGERDDIAPVDSQRELVAACSAHGRLAVLSGTGAPAASTKPRPRWPRRSRVRRGLEDPFRLPVRADRSADGIGRDRLGLVTALARAPGDLVPAKTVPNWRTCPTGRTTW